MATTFKDIKEADDQFKKLTETTKLYSKNLKPLEEFMEKLRDSGKKYNTILERSTNLHNRIKATIEEETHEVHNLAKKLEDINRYKKESINSSNVLRNIYKDHAKQMENTLATESNIIATKNTIFSISNSIKDLENEIQSVNVKKLTTEQLLHGFGGKQLQNAAARLVTEKKHLTIAEENLSKSISLHKEKAKQDAISYAKMGIAEGMLGKHATAFKKINDIAKTNPYLAIIMAAEEIFKILLNQNAEVVEFQKNLNVSGEEARNIRNRFVEMERSASGTGSAFKYMKNYIEASSNLSNMLGVSVDFSGKRTSELLNNQIKLTKQIGLSGEEGANFLKISQGSGLSLDQMQTAINRSSVRFKQFNGIAISGKDIMQGISKMSSAAALSLSKFPEKLADAVIKSKQLGVSMDKMNSMSDGLLNIEESISAQFEASVLTGKNLNFELAREKALRNDIAGAAEEVMKQVGSAADFANMNRIQQEAIAKAVGINKDELADSLLIQENQSNLSSKTKADLEERLKGLSTEQRAEIQKKVNSEESAKAAMEEVSAKEKLNAMQEKFMSILENLLAPLEPVVAAFADIMEFLGPIIGFAAKLYSIFSPTMIIIRFIVEFFKEWYNQFQLILEPLTEMLGGSSGIMDIFSMIADFLGGTIIKHITNIGKLVAKFVLAPFELVIGVIRGIIKMFQGDFAGAFELIGKSIINFLTAPIRLIIGVVDSIINGLIAVANKVIEYIPGVSPIGEVNMADSLKLAKGGIVSPKPGGVNATIAEGGEAELVSPLSKLPGMLGELVKSTPMGMIADLLGGSGLFGETSPSAGDTIIIEKIDKLISTLEKKSFIVNLDGKQVSKQLTEVSQAKFARA